jgi:hypothetical protein
MRKPPSNVANSEIAFSLPEVAKELSDVKERVKRLEEQVFFGYGCR